MPLDIDSYPASYRPDPIQNRVMDRRDIRDLRRWHAEAAMEPGGRVVWESRLPGLVEWRRVIEYRIQQQKKLQNVEIYLNSRLTADDILSFGFRHVAIATGSYWRTDGVGRRNTVPVESFNNQGIYSPDDIMKDASVRGPVVIFDDDHYYMGSLIAEKLKAEGHGIVFVTPSGYVAEWTINTDEQKDTQAGLLEMGVEIVTGSVVTGFDGGKAQLSCVFTGRQDSVPASTIVSVTARIPDDELYCQLMQDPPILEK